MLAYVATEILSFPFLCARKNFSRLTSMRTHSAAESDSGCGSISYLRQSTKSFEIVGGKPQLKCRVLL